MSGRFVNKRQLAEMLDVSSTTLDDWQAQGLPIQERGAPGQENTYDVAAVFQWYGRRAALKVAGESQGDRHLRLKSDLLERELAEKDKTLVPVDQIEPVWRGAVLAGTSFMLGRHSRLAGLLEATPGVEAKRALLKQEDAEFLAKLGVNGERYMLELQALLDSLSPEVVESFYRRLEPAPLHPTGDTSDQP
jgi:hypothetical protein